MLHEMTFHRAKVLEKLDSFGEMMLEHLVKVFYYHDDNKNIHGWSVSLCKAFIQIPKIKTSKGSRSLEKKEIKDELWIGLWDKGEKIDDLHEIEVEFLNTAYTNLPKIKNIKHQEFKDFVEDFLDFIADIATSKTEKIKPTAVENFIVDYFKNNH